MGSCGMSCVKYLVFFFNFLFAITGLIVLTAGAIIQSSYSHYSNFVGETIWTAPLLLMIVGGVVFLVAFFGCCGAAKESSCMILTFSVMLVLIFLAEIAVGVAGYLKHQELSGILQNGFDKTLSDYNRSTDAQRAWSFVQTEMECCGINGPEDWEPIYNNDTVPRSCCPNLSTQETQCTQRTATRNGCMPKLLSFLDSKSLILAAVGLGIALAQLLGVIFACCLSRSFRVNYETV